MLCRQSNLDVRLIMPEYRHFDNHLCENSQNNFQNTFSPSYSYVSCVRPRTIHCNTSHKVQIHIGSNKEKGSNVTEKYKAAFLQLKLYHAHTITPPSALYEQNFSISTR
jgi:hypothetical protein